MEAVWHHRAPKQHAEAFPQPYITDRNRAGRPRGAAGARPQEHSCFPVFWKEGATDRPLPRPPAGLGRRESKGLFGNDGSGRRPSPAGWEPRRIPAASQYREEHSAAGRTLPRAGRCALRPPAERRNLQPVRPPASPPAQSFHSQLAAEDFCGSAATPPAGNPVRRCRSIGA